MGSRRTADHRHRKVPDVIGGRIEETEIDGDASEYPKEEVEHEVGREPQTLLCEHVIWGRCARVGTWRGAAQPHSERVRAPAAS